MADPMAWHGGGRRRCCEIEGRAPGPGARGRGALLEPAVLASLGEQRAHGYDLRKTVEAMTGGRVCVDPGGLYRLLRRLEEDGFVQSAWLEGEHGPQRREYGLTDDGRALLAHWKEYLVGEIEAHRSVVDAIDATMASAP